MTDALLSPYEKIEKPALRMMISQIEADPCYSSSSPLNHETCISNEKAPRQRFVSRVGDQRDHVREDSDQYNPLNMVVQIHAEDSHELYTTDPPTAS